MRKNIFRLMMLAAMPMLLALGITSCAEHDNPVDPNPLADQVKGIWWTLFDQEGTTATGQAFTRVGTGFQLLEDGTGYGATFYFNNDEGDPIEMRGGKDFTPFTYTTSQDGTITLHFEKRYQPDVDYFKGMTLRYQDGHISLASPRFTTQLELANEQVTALIEQWDQTMNGGASADNYNINDEDFTPTTWREQEAIYIYDGKGQDATDAKGRTGYTLVNMPWYDGDVQSNLPNGFCDDITPGNGWEWVLNRCGSRNAVNNNFFAVYNKYTGTLRFFFCMPGEFSTGNDHVWQVSMTDHLAQQSTWPYGIPEDKTLVDKATIGQTGDGTFMTYVTPWTNYMSDDGLITPNAGWWAFDIDLSQTRLDDVQSGDNIRLQMRSWNTQHVSLSSTIHAAIEGNFAGNLDASVNLLQSQHLNNSAMGITAKVGSMVGNLGTAIYNIVSADGDKGKAFSGIVEFAKGGCNLAGIKTETAHDIEGSIKGKMEGTITLGLSGNIDTEGTIRGSYPTVGVASPTIHMKDFDTKNSHLGQGVWNLKTAPVVYWTNVDAWWEEHHWQAGEAYRDGKWVPIDYYNYCQMTPYFFDPNSVEIELNPNVFPTSEIEWVEVDAVCGARKGRQLRNDALRSAFGVGGSTARQFAKNGRSFSDFLRYWIPVKLSENDLLMDFLRDYDDKLGMSQSHVIYSQDNGYSFIKEFSWTETVKGRGADGYAIEPQYLGGYQTGYMPFLEVSVTVLVKLKSMDTPIVLSRNYLPEIKSFDKEEFNNAVRKTKPYASKMQGHTELYDYQMKRIYTILSDYDVDAVFPDGFWPKLTATSGSPGWSERYSYKKIFDRDWSTDWQSPNTNKNKDNVWFVEFQSTWPISPKSYYMTITPSCYAYVWEASTNPDSWTLWGKEKEGDDWVLLDKVTGDTKMPAGYNTKQVRVEYPLSKSGTWQYFRLEIGHTRNEDGGMSKVLELAEFDFGTN
jgi:hypothetical protein